MIDIDVIYIYADRDIDISQLHGYLSPESLWIRGCLGFRIRRPPRGDGRIAADLHGAHGTLPEAARRALRRRHDHVLLADVIFVWLIYRYLNIYEYI